MFLPVLPTDSPHLGVVFDCCSFGQYLGRLGRGSSVLQQHGWVGRHQFQGKALAEKQYVVEWRQYGALFQPMLRKNAADAWPIANLHI